MQRELENATLRERAKEEEKERIGETERTAERRDRGHDNCFAERKTELQLLWRNDRRI